MTHGGTDKPGPDDGGKAHGEPDPAHQMLAEELWREVINIWKWPGNLIRVPAAQRLIAAGADRGDLLAAMRAAAYLAVEFTMFRIEAGHGEPRPWFLAETNEAGVPTNRVVEGVSASLERFDPSGAEGADLWR